jgi:hypothetical protein
MGYIALDEGIYDLELGFIRDEVLGSTVFI